MANEPQDVRIFPAEKRRVCSAYEWWALQEIETLFWLAHRRLREADPTGFQKWGPKIAALQKEVRDYKDHLDPPERCLPKPPQGETISLFRENRRDEP